MSFNTQGLYLLSGPELVQFSKDNGISLSGNYTKHDLIEIIKSNLNPDVQPVIRDSLVQHFTGQVFLPTVGVSPTKVVSPAKVIASVKTASLPTSVRAVSPPARAVSPPARAVSPPARAVSPRTGAVSPRTGAVSPRTGAVSPRTGAVSPPARAVSPPARAVSPRASRIKISPVCQSAAKSLPNGEFSYPCIHRDYYAEFISPGFS